MTINNRITFLVVFLLALLTALPRLAAQNLGPQHLAFAGLLSANHQGQFNAVATDATGNLYLLLDEKDGVRLLKTDAGTTTVLASALIGAAGDIGLAMALDPAGNVYVTGTSTSGSLTATSGAAFPTPVGTTVNSFVAKFDAALNLKFVTFGGSGSAPASAIAASADAVFITGLIYGNGLPVTPAGILQAPAYGSVQNGFVEKFSSDGTTLLYATYLTGQSSTAVQPNDTSPQVITVDAQDDAYVAGFTTATGYPTIAALVPRAVGTTSGFLTELTPGGDGIIFSTFIPGSGISSMALDTTGNTLLLSGTIALGQFPVATVTMPLAATMYQVLLRMAIDGSAVLSSTLLAPGTQSFLMPAPGGAVWVDGALPTGSINVPLPLLPSGTAANVGNSFAVRVSPVGTQGATIIDQAARFGGLAASNPNYVSLPVNLTALAVDASGSAVFVGSAQPTASSSLLPSQTFDLALTNTPTSAMPSAVRDAVADPASCGGSSACAGSAAYLARLTPTAAASLAFSTDASPTIVLRNLGSMQATGLQIAATGFTTGTDCGTSLNAGGECTIVLSGNGPGTLTVTATNATAQTATLSAIPAGTVAKTLVFSPREIDYGIQTATSPAATRTITITNVGQQTQTFTSKLNGNAAFLPYSVTESASDCILAGLNTSKQLGAGASCHITLAFAASSNAAKDGPAQANWSVGTGNVLLTGFSQAAALNLSATEIDFGTQFYGGLRSARYLYISNNSTSALTHTPLSVPSGSPFTLTDGCPTQLNPHTVCRVQLGYQSTLSTSTDATTLALDQGLSVLVTGQTIPQPGTTGASAPPSLSVTPTTLTFPTPVVVTGVSGSTQTVTIQNTGTSAFSLALALTGDFTDQTNCVASLAAGATCTVVLTFAPSQPGARQGLLGVTAGSGTSPVYVSLNGMGTAILPANNGSLDFGDIFVGQPVVQWYKVSQPFSTLTTATLSPTFKVLLVEDTGSGHGQFPASAFLQATTGTCNNCWLGVQFTPPAVGAQASTLSLLSSTAGNAYTRALTGNGLPLTGVVLAPLSNNFGPIAVNSSSAPQLYTLTNLSGATISVTNPSLTGDFALGSQPVGTAACSGMLANNASCFFQVIFAPTATGQRSGTVTVQTNANSPTVTLTGFGVIDPGIAFNPAALVFNTGSPQTITVKNTGTASVTIGTLTTGTAAFQASTTCGTLAPAASCTITITYTPSTATVTDTLQVPVTATAGGSSVTTTYTVALSGTYTAATAGLQILPATQNFGPSAANALGGIRQFTINNLTAKSLSLNLTLPREFVLTGAPCTALAPNAGCNFSMSFLPVTSGDITGSLLAQGTPTDGSATVNGIGYLEGYGVGTNNLTITGNIGTGRLVNFGQVASGQSAQQVLTLTNTSTGTSSVTVHRVTSQWPFLSTTTCGATLAVTQSCTVTVTYTPLNQVATGVTSPPGNTDGGALLIESDAASSPDTINLTGTANPTAVASPTNTPPLTSLFASQSALTFPSTAIGFSSAPQYVTLVNTGNTVVHITGLTASSDFAASGNCAVLLPAASCTLTITFVPQVSPLGSGLRPGVVEITSDASTSLEFLSLIGAAGASALTFQPASLVFPVELVGSTTTLPFQITNAGTTAAVFNGIATTGDYTASGNCPASGASLAASAGCTVQVAFTPTATGVRPGTLSIASSVSTIPLTASLTGTGAQSNLAISTGGLNFGSVLIGATGSLSLTLANSGTTTITGISLATTGDYAVSIPCPLPSLAAGASCAVTVAFTPTATGTRTGTLTITSSDPSSPNTVSLTGTGVAQAHLQASTNSLNFGNIAVGASATLPLTLTNNGIATITGIVFAATGDYAVPGACASVTLAASASCTINIVFTPTITGTRTGALTIISSDPGSPTTVALTGTGTLQTHLQVSANSLSFGNVVVGANSTMPLTLTNNGTATITAIAFAATGDYAVPAACASTTLAAGASCTINIVFTPTITGTRTGALTITSSDPGSPSTVALSGTGTAPPGLSNASFTLTVDGGTTSTQTVSQTRPATYALVVTPQNGFTGTVVLSCSPILSATGAVCSMLPSSVTLNGASQSATVTINTISSSKKTMPLQNRINPIRLCLLTPVALLFWRSRRVLRKQRLSLLAALLSVSAMLLVSGCGSSGGTSANLKISPTGTYQYSVTASSTNGTPVMQTVTLNLVIH